MIEKLGELIENLQKVFKYRNGILIFNKKMQEEANSLLSEFASLSGTFENTIKNERSNIEEELTIIDTQTGEKISLIDISNMNERVKNLLTKNNVFSCLKALALSNKCAHIFDGKIKEVKNKIEEYYSLLYPLTLDAENFSFADSVETHIPEDVYELYPILEEFNDHQFSKLYKVLFNNTKLNKGVKISVLKSLNISFDIKSDEEINRIFDVVLENKYNFVYSYLFYQFKKGEKLLSLQNKMFGIKDNYISMIGQLLKQDERFIKVNYELVRTEDAKPGFEYMLIVDDKDLQYYIEVHMPNFIATTLIKQHGLKESTERKTIKLGASAVYERKSEEVSSVFDALNKGNISDSGKRRAKIITRDLDVDGGIELFQEKNDADYLFITEKISKRLSLMESYLIDNKMHLDEVEFNRDLFNNENFSIEFIKNIVNKKYYSIFINFYYDEKENFIKYSLSKLLNGDAFDKFICEKIFYNLDNYNLIGKLLINIDDLKEKFINNYKYSIDENLNFIQIKDKFDYLIDKYINEYIEDEIDKENDLNGFTR